MLIGGGVTLMLILGGCDAHLIFLGAKKSTGYPPSNMRETQEVFIAEFEVL